MLARLAARCGVKQAAALQRAQGSGAAAASRAPARRLAEQAGKGAEDDAGKAAKEAGGWLSGFLKSKIHLFVAAGLGVIALNAGASLAADWYYHKSVLDTLMRGVLPPALPPPELERPQLRARIMDLLQPPEASKFYFIVTGPPGGGKSTLLREGCRALGSGVGYLDVDPAFEVDFGRDLGNAFGFRFQEHITALNMVAKPILGTQYEDPHGEHPLASVRKSAEALHDAALEFKRRTGKPFVLVIDSADRLARNEDSEKVLYALRADARDWANDGSVTTVFVAHEFSTVEKLTGDHPAQSRAAPPVRVPDITQEEATQYLQALGVPDKQAGKCADLVGGSLLLLQRCATATKAGMPFADLKNEMLEMIELAFLQAGLLDQTPQRAGGLRAIEALLRSKNGTIGAADWRECVPQRDLQQALLNRGVLIFDGRRLAFASRLAETYAAEALRARLPKSVGEQHKGLKPPGWW